MKITVRVNDIELSVDRPNFVDHAKESDWGAQHRENIMKDTILPTVADLCSKAINILTARKTFLT